MSPPTTTQHYTPRMATTAELTSALERLIARNVDAVILQGSLAYVQAEAPPRTERLALEAVSDQFLDAPLTTEQLLKLRRHGFAPPDQARPNHWRYFETDPAGAADVLSTTLADVYGDTLEEAEVVEV